MNQFWAGFIIYTASYALVMTGGKVPAKVSYLELLGLLIFLQATFQLIRLRIENPYLRNIYIFYLVWLAIVVVRGFSFNKEYLFNTFIDGSEGIFLYLAPLILLFPRNISFLKKLIKVTLLLSIFYMLCNAVFIKSILMADDENGKAILEYFSKFLGIPCGFILLISTYDNDEKRHLIKKLWVLFVIVFTFLLAVIRARRSLMFMSANILLASYIIYNYANKTNLFFKFFPIFLVFFVSVYSIKLFTEKNPGKFKLITERFNEDTRSDVEEYFYLDLSNKDWIIGKGIDGMFYCPTGATEDGYRSGIETDYLTIVLKGGLVSLGLLLLITIPAVIKGIFYSKNVLSKAAGTWILLWMMDLFPATVTTFSLNYLLVWVCIGICYSKEIRNIPEDVMKKALSI